jgi:phosphoglycerate dehydrogenase-like enzyme
LITESALITALKHRKIAGAGLDVYEIEPLPLDHPYRSLENAITTPHIGYVTKQIYETFYGHTVQNILAWLDGRPIRVMEL